MSAALTPFFDPEDFIGRFEAIALARGAFFGADFLAETRAFALCAAGFLAEAFFVFDLPINLMRRPTFGAPKTEA